MGIGDLDDDERTFLANIAAKFCDKPPKDYLLIPVKDWFDAIRHFDDLTQIGAFMKILVYSGVVGCRHSESTPGLPDNPEFFLRLLRLRPTEKHRKMICNVLVEFHRCKGRLFHSWALYQFRKLKTAKSAEGDGRITISARLRFKILSRDGFRCQYCGRGKGEVRLCIDHMIPVSEGGATEEPNLITACFDCNAGKTDHFVVIPEMFRESQ